MKNILLSERNSLAYKSVEDGDIDSDGDETDEIQAKLIADINKKLNIRNNTKIKQIDDALKKIEEKTYGSCEDCGDMVPEKRLLANPHCLTCVYCAEEREFYDSKKKK